MKIEVGKTYRVTGGTMNGATVKIIAVDKKNSPVSYRYVRVDGAHQFFNWFDAGSQFAGWLRPVDPEMKIVVLRDGNKVTATSYRDGEKITTGVAKCSPEDKFDFAVGSRIALKRLFAKIDVNSKFGNPEHNSGLTRDYIYHKTKDVMEKLSDSEREEITADLQAIDDLESAFDWEKFSRGEMYVEVDRETIYSFLYSCELGGYKWNSGEEPTEMNPFTIYDKLHPITRLLADAIGVGLGTKTYIRSVGKKLVMNDGDNLEDCEVYKW
jgi:hypothetical protein|nr:MAG TPA: hypothetical protein [Caudoviricetes sp.]